MSLGNEEEEQRSFLGLPARMVLAVGGVGVPWLAVGLFSAMHAWPPPPPCGFAVFGCPTAPHPVSSQAADWLFMSGPILGLALSAYAIYLPAELAERGLRLYRYLVPLIGLFSCLGCAVQLTSWITHAGPSA